MSIISEKLAIHGGVRIIKLLPSLLRPMIEIQWVLPWWTQLDLFWSPHHKFRETRSYWVFYMPFTAGKKYFCDGYYC